MRERRSWGRYDPRLRVGHFTDTCGGKLNWPTVNYEIKWFMIRLYIKIGLNSFYKIRECGSKW